MIAPVAASGWPAASNDTNQRSPRESRIVNPGAKPASFGDTTLQGPGAGPLPVIGPRDTSSGVTARVRMRLVNQFESGTSSIVLTFLARTSGVGSPGRPKRLVARSMNRSISHSLHLRGVLRLGLPCQRIVVEEPALGAGEQRRAGGQKAAQSESRHESCWCRHDQNAALAANTSCTPSDPFANSTRSGVRAGA